MDTREALRRMRNLKNGIIENFNNDGVNDAVKKEMSMRDMLKITRKKKLNESETQNIDLNKDGKDDATLMDITTDNKKTIFDQKDEERKFREAIKNYNVDVQFEPIEILDNAIIWNGTIDNQIQWSFLVTPDENVNGAKFNYAKTFDDTKPDNEELIKDIKSYYDTFYKFWRDNELEI